MCMCVCVSFAKRTGLFEGSGELGGSLLLEVSSRRLPSLSTLLLLEGLLPPATKVLVSESLSQGCFLVLLRANPCLEQDAPQAFINGMNSTIPTIVGGCAGGAVASDTLILRLRTSSSFRIVAISAVLYSA